MGLIRVSKKNISGSTTRMCTLKPVAMVSIYIPTAANISNPEVATVLVISPSTPMGASLIIISVIRIMAWKRDSKKEVNCDLWFPLSWVMAAPRKMAKNMRPNISPFAAAEMGFNGIIRIRISAGEPGVFNFDASNESAVGKFTPTPG